MTEQRLSQRSFVIAGIAVVIVIIFISRLFTLQILSPDYKKSAESIALLKKTALPARGVIKDRHKKLLVYNSKTYDLMVVMNEVNPNMDTIDLCRTLGVSKEEFIQRIEEIKDYSKNPAYSRYTQQVVFPQLTAEDFNIFEEKKFRFPGFSVQRRYVRQYAKNCAAHVLGEVGEVNADDILEDDYYQSGEYKGKIGIEYSYEQQLRGKKGVNILLRDSRGRVRGQYEGGRYDVAPHPGKDLTLSLDLDLQLLAESLMVGHRGSIVAIEPSTGEVLCMVSAPSYDLRILNTKQRAKYVRQLQNDERKPLVNRAIMGTYPPGSTFKPSQALTFLQEGIIDTLTSYPCHHGFRYKRMKVGCHGHASPLRLRQAISTSCNGYFCWGLYNMLNNRHHYSSLHSAMSKWRDYMVSMGFGYTLGIDLPGEKRGMIPNAEFYDKAYNEHWNPLTVISISIGQGEVTNTPLQIANQAATIANRGYYIVPHMVKGISEEEIDKKYKERHYTMVDRRNYEHVVQGMRSAVLRGTCAGTNIPGVEVCGKTGTAQNRGSDHSVFMGFAPRQNPRIAIAIYVENGGFGARTAVPMARQLFTKYLNVQEKHRTNKVRQKIKQPDSLTVKV